MKNLLALVMCLSFVSINVFAESRVDAVITSSVESQLAEISKLKNDIEKAEVQLGALNIALEVAVKKNKGHEFFLETRKLSGFMTLATIFTTGAVIVLARTKVNTAIMSFVVGAPVTLLSGTVLLGSQIGVMLTNDEADELRADIKELKKFASDAKKQINKEIQVLCRMNYESAACN